MRSLVEREFFLAGFGPIIYKVITYYMQGILMETEVLIALMGVVGVIFGALITAIVQYLSSRQKLKELQISYSNNIYEKSIESARNNLEDLYLPLYQEMSSLLYHYTKYRNACRIAESSNKDGNEEVKEKLGIFMNHTLAFGIEVDDIFQSGLAAYLIGTIEDRLIDLRDLLEQSMKEHPPIVETGVTTTIRVSSFGTRAIHNKNINKILPLKYTPKFFGNDVLKIGFPGFIQTEVKIKTKILSAPLNSEMFEKQFMEYIIEIKRELREVTLWLKE